MGPFLFRSGIGPWRFEKFWDERSSLVMWKNESRGGLMKVLLCSRWFGRMQKRSRRFFSLSHNNEQTKRRKGFHKEGNFWFDNARGKYGPRYRSAMNGKESGAFEVHLSPFSRDSVRLFVCLFVNAICEHELRPSNTTHKGSPCLSVTKLAAVRLKWFECRLN